MSTEYGTADWEAEIDRRIEVALRPNGEARMPLARSAATDVDDRWFGLVLVRSYESIASGANARAVLPAAAAVELLRAYYRLRIDLLSQAADECFPGTSRDVTPALLAGDYLYATAYSTLDDAATGPLEPCFRTLTSVSASIIDALAAGPVTPADPAAEYGSFVDDTAGALGEGAALVGATLAGADDSLREQFATVGRGFATRRRIAETLETGAGESDPPVSDPTSLRRHGRRRFEAATRAVGNLPTTVDVGPLRKFVSERSP